MLRLVPSQRSFLGLFDVNWGILNEFPTTSNEGMKKNADYNSTLANCSSFELGSREVVTTIFGSWIPALEYSLSMCVLGSTINVRKEYHKPKTYQFGPHQKPGHGLEILHLS
jgi:hypothetical protein